MKRSYKIISASLSAALLVACGGANSSFTSSTPMSVAPIVCRAHYNNPRKPKSFGIIAR